MAARSLDNVIATLNQLGVGDLERILGELRSVKDELRRSGLSEELVTKLDECERALGRGDLETFRKLRETIVSRLGHLRVKGKD